MQSDIIRIGTRASPLAMAQAQETARLLVSSGRTSEAVRIVPIRTSGDRIQDRPLAEAGGKGLFTKEIEEALLAGEIDIAVHSAKDVPASLPDGLELGAFLKREDARDAFIGRDAPEIDALPQGAKVATSSPRRRAMLLRYRKDLQVIDIRGNVDTRLRKLSEGYADATLLAIAGLRRLGLGNRASSLIGTDIFVPAVGQGAIAIEMRSGDVRISEALAGIAHGDTSIAVEAERAFQAALGGSCRTPIGGHAVIEGGRVLFHGIIVTPDGQSALETHRQGEPGDARRLGREAGEELARLGGPRFFDKA